MPVRFRRSFSLFPGARLNLSKSGVSVSLGRPGATINLGPRGSSATLSLPGTGLSYRMPLHRRHPAPSEGSNGLPAAPFHVSPMPEPGQLGYPHEEGGEITSAPVGTLTSASLADLKQLIVEARQRRATLRAELKVAITARDAAYRWHYFRSRPPFKWIAGGRIPAVNTEYDRRQIHLEETANALSSCFLRFDFELPPLLAEAWRELRQAHGDLCKSYRIWDITAEVAIDRYKTRSPASWDVSRRSIALGQGRIENNVIATPETPLRFGNVTGVTLDFYPGLCMVQGRGDFDLVSILDIEARYVADRFVESETIPGDAKVIDYAWQKSNKDGSRDKRFAVNRQIPVVLYGALDMKSGTGINEAYMFSNAEAARQFASVFQAVKNAQRSTSTTSAASGSGPVDNGVTDEFAVTVPDPVLIPRWFLFAMTVVTLLSVGGVLYETNQQVLSSILPVVGIRIPSSEQSTALPRAGTPSPPGPYAPARPTVMIKMPANIRTSARAGAAIVGMAKAGDKLAVFDRANGWVQVGPPGAQKPIGWVWAALTSPD
jgi:Protein of unknown function (DUF4236)/Bacterial SH3 domain